MSVFAIGSKDDGTVEAAVLGGEVELVVRHEALDFQHVDPVGRTVCMPGQIAAQVLGVGLGIGVVGQTMPAELFRPL